jgi:hypothetical protein
VALSFGTAPANPASPPILLCAPANINIPSTSGLDTVKIILSVAKDFFDRRQPKITIQASFPTVTVKAAHGKNSSRTAHRSPLPNLSDQTPPPTGSRAAAEFYFETTSPWARLYLSPSSKRYVTKAREKTQMQTYSCHPQARGCPCPAHTPAALVLARFHPSSGLLAPPRSTAPIMLLSASSPIPPLRP